MNLNSGSPDFAIENVLGPRTREVLASAHSAETFIIRTCSSGNLDSAQILANGLSLSAEQLQSIKTAVDNPQSYYNGEPVFRRLPPAQNFAIQFHSDAGSLDLMLDLMNPSWSFYCAAESYQAWHWVGPLFRQIAKDAFPKLASASANSVWKKGVISNLERVRISRITSSSHREDPGRSGPQ